MLQASSQVLAASSNVVEPFESVTEKSLNENLDRSDRDYHDKSSRSKRTMECIHKSRKHGKKKKFSFSFTFGDDSDS